MAQALPMPAPLPAEATIGQPRASKIAWLVTRGGSSSRPCTITAKPCRASRPASRGVRLGSLRAPLYEGSQTTGRALD